MASRSTQTSREMLLRAQEIRELIRDARGGSVPDYVARALRDRYMEPYEEDAVEIAELLGDLVETARLRIEENGIEPLHDEHGRPPKLPKRERQSVANLAMLMATRSAALLFAERREEALEIAREGLAWGRTAQDHEQLALGLIALYAIYERLGRWGEQREAIVQAYEEARACRNVKVLIDSLLPLISFLIEAMELDEAERLNNEVQTILRDDLTLEDRHSYHAVSLSHAARIARYRGREAESILGFREALRWADAALYPLTRCSILSHLGSSYIMLNQHRQCIECQRELVEIADAIGIDKLRSLAYMNLAETHQRLEEYEQAMELLDHAERYGAGGPWEQISWIMLRRAELLIPLQRSEEAAVLCRQIIESAREVPRIRRLYIALCMLGQIEEQCLRYESALEYYHRAVGETESDRSKYFVAAQLGIARMFHALEQYDEALATLDSIVFREATPPAREIQALRLRAAIAEDLGDLRTVIDCERRAASIEQELLARKSEQSLRSARIMLETDLLEREAELERERRRRLERELASAVVALGDTRHAVAAEKRLRDAIGQSTGTSGYAMTAAVHDVLHAFSSGAHSQETVHHYLSKVEKDFLLRLRQRYPGITRSQERLCGLLRAGLDFKVIGSLLGLQPEGLKALRKRLRRQLGLEPETALEKFLAEF
ncbi:MAG: hypothetical protein JST22_01455 [Bacteroidetes bacterium]|nr:hypothetical protein [Bacteroidota bacterium]